MRTTQTTGRSTTVYDNANLTGYAKPIEERDGTTNAVERSYVLGFSVESQSDATNGTLTLLHDGHGTTRALADDNGAVDSTDIYNFDAWGNAINFTESTAKTTWLAADGREDPITGHRYNLARDLDESTGAWLSQDAMIFGPDQWQDANLHLYGGENPVFHSDASGNMFNVELLVTNFIDRLITNMNDAQKTAQGAFRSAQMLVRLGLITMITKVYHENPQFAVRAVAYYGFEEVAFEERQKQFAERRRLASQSPGLAKYLVKLAGSTQMLNDNQIDSPTTEGRPFLAGDGKNTSFKTFIPLTGKYRYDFAICRALYIAHIASKSFSITNA